MAKLGDLLKEAVTKKDAVMAGQLSDFMRMKGMMYKDQLELAQKLTQCSEMEWEDLMYRADTEMSYG